ncbi:MAG: DoxX family protein [Amphritea sp.]
MLSRRLAATADCIDKMEISRKKKNGVGHAIISLSDASAFSNPIENSQGKVITQTGSEAMTTLRKDARLSPALKQNGNTTEVLSDTIEHLQLTTGLAQSALILRTGLGLVFVIGGLMKLSMLLNPATKALILQQYLGPLGYINESFHQYLFFEGSWLTPALFLTTLSGFELLSGGALILGLWVRPLSLFYGFLLWTFVIALPTHTVPELVPEVETYRSPAMLIQIRDIALSGMMFVLFNIGAGKASLDQRWFPHTQPSHWQELGLLLRFSMAIVFIVAGFFSEFDHIPSFSCPPWLLAIIGLALIFGNSPVVRSAAAVAMAVMLWFMASKFSIDLSIIANLNGFKREFALGAAAVVLMLQGGGNAFTLADIAIRCHDYWACSFTAAKDR